MKKKLTVLACILTMTCSFLLSGCRSVSVSSKSESTTEKETTTKKSNKETTDDETSTKETEKETKKKTGENPTLAWDSSQDSSSWKDYTNTGYSLKAPESDWRMGVVVGADFALQHSSTGTGAFAENINVVIQDLSTYKMDLESYKDLSFKQYKQLNYELLSNDEVEVNGTDGYYVTIKLTKDGTELTCAQYFTIVDNKAYVFTLNADTADFDSVEQDFINILYTVHFDSLT